MVRPLTLYYSVGFHLPRLSYLPCSILYSWSNAEVWTLLGYSSSLSHPRQYPSDPLRETSDSDTLVRGPLGSKVYHRCASSFSLRVFRRRVPPHRPVLRPPSRDRTSGRSLVLRFVVGDPKVTVVVEGGTIHLKSPPPLNPFLSSLYDTFRNVTYDNTSTQNFVILHDNLFLGKNISNKKIPV